MAYHGRYHILFLWICPWYHYYGISYLLLRMIYANDIIITGYHSHTISHILWYHSLCHGTCAAGWRWLGAPGARCSAGSSHAIANMLGTCVQLNCDYLDAVHGLVALAAARVMHCCRFVVIKKSRLAAAAAAGCAAHAGKAPMQRGLGSTVQAPDSDDIWASRMVLDFKMDSCWKLPVAEWRRRVRPESTCTATSTWKLEFWVRADCGAAEPGGGGRLRKHIMRAICSGHLWGVEKCTFSRLS